MLVAVLLLVGRKPRVVLRRVVRRRRGRCAYGGDGSRRLLRRPRLPHHRRRWLRRPQPRRLRTTGGRRVRVLWVSVRLGGSGCGAGRRLWLLPWLLLRHRAGRGGLGAVRWRVGRGGGAGRGSAVRVGRGSRRYAVTGGCTCVAQGSGSLVQK